MNYIINRLKEKSTYLFIFTFIVNVFDITVSPEVQQMITEIIIGIISLVGIFIQENN